MARQLDAERFHLLHALSTPGVVVASLFALLGAVFLSPHVSQVALQTWVTLKLLVAAARILHLEWHRSHHGRHHRAWRLQCLALLLLDGCIWGSAGFLALQGHTTLTLVVAACLMGVATLACFSLQAHWLFAAAYSLPVVLPTSALLLAQGDAWLRFTGLGMALFALAQLVAAHQAQRRLVALLQDRITTDQQVRDNEAELRLARQENALKSHFVATMSHELRTPLHGILGLTRMLRSARLDPTDRQRLALVERSGEHLLSVINNILDLSRIEAGHLTLSPEPFDLHELLHDVAALTQVTAQEKGLRLRTDLRLPRPCVVRGDPARVRQILLNLLGNAVKFTEQGDVLLSAWRHAPDAPVILQVRDTGIGIPTEAQAHIFAAFRQIDGALDSRFGGTGLGLTISREIARAMQGEITCQSTPGRGSTFELSLPLPADRTAQHTLSTRLDAEAAQAQQARAVRLRGQVLLAEDNEVNAMVVHALLARHGLGVEVCTDGAAVLARLRDGSRPRPDLVLMDCHMPEMDGFEATRQLRADEQARGLPRLPVVALTASALAEDSQRCLDAGMDAYLPKPFRDEQLLAVLLSWLPHGASATLSEAA